MGQGGTELVMQQVSRYGIMLTRRVSFSTSSTNGSGESDSS